MVATDKTFTLIYVHTYIYIHMYSYIAILIVVATQKRRAHKVILKFCIYVHMCMHLSHVESSRLWDLKPKT